MSHLSLHLSSVLLHIESNVISKCIWYEGTQINSKRMDWLISYIRNYLERHIYAFLFLFLSFSLTASHLLMYICMCVCVCTARYKYTYLDSMRENMAVAAAVDVVVARRMSPRVCTIKHCSWFSQILAKYTAL